MMEWIVNAGKDINGVIFGADRENVRSEWGFPVKEFRKSKYSKNTTDDYGDYHVFYDANNKLEAVEIFEGTVIVNNKKIFPANVEEIMQTEESYQKDDDGCTSNKLSVGIYAPTGKAESILVGCEGYY